MNTITNRYRKVRTPIGLLSLVVNDRDELLEVHWEHDGAPPHAVEDAAGAPEAARQLEEYFNGTRREFSLELAPEGTEFQKSVWHELLNIPYGETRSYGQIAAAIGRFNAVRAVGAANGANPIPVIIPCHRVIGSNGTLTGFGGGLDIKAKLLELEGALLPL